MKISDFKRITICYKGKEYSSEKFLNLIGRKTLKSTDCPNIWKNIEWMEFEFND